MALVRVIDVSGVASTNDIMRAGDAWTRRLDAACRIVPSGNDAGEFICVLLVERDANALADTLCTVPAAATPQRRRVYETLDIVDPVAFVLVALQPPLAAVVFLRRHERVLRTASSFTTMRVETWTRRAMLVEADPHETFRPVTSDYCDACDAYMNPFADATPPTRCARCHVPFCSLVCQNVAWPAHKHVCRALARIRAHGEATNRALRWL